MSGSSLVVTWTEEEEGEDNYDHRDHRNGQEEEKCWDNYDMEMVKGMMMMKIDIELIAIDNDRYGGIGTPRILGMIMKTLLKKTRSSMRTRMTWPPSD